MTSLAAKTAQAKDRVAALVARKQRELKEREEKDAEVARRMQREAYGTMRDREPL